MEDTKQVPDLWADDGKTLSPYRLRKFLEENGFGQFMTTSDRTTKRFFFRNDNNVLKTYNADNIRGWMIKYVEGCMSEENEGSVINLIEKISKYSSDKLTGEVLVSIKSFGEFSSEDAEMINLASDEPNKCYIRFRNGVVVITKSSIQLVPYSRFETEGSVWEASIIPRDIKIEKDPNHRGLFEKFVFNSMRTRDHKIEAMSEWMDEYPITDNVRTNFEALRSSIGYLIHRDNSVQKAIIYVDQGSTLTEPEGSNGKTLIMKSISYFTDRLTINGKAFYNDGGSRFAFSNVKPSTGLIHIDDLKAGFKFEDLFAFLTGDLEVEGKGTKKIIIPEEKKPKFGITTNYVISGSGTSFARRQQIIEFGDYWNRATKEGENVWDEKHLGKRLFEREFTEQDWIDFYNFGFKCIQLYLERGLLDTCSGTYSEKVLAKSIAKEPEVSEWIMNYVHKGRLVNDPKNRGVYMYQIHKWFTEDLPSDITSKWDAQRLQKAIFDYVMGSEGYDYNPERSDKGESMSSRRVLKGARGEQQNLITIVHKDDTIKSTKSVDPNAEWLEEYDAEKYFEDRLEA